MVRGTPNSKFQIRDVFCYFVFESFYFVNIRKLYFSVSRNLSKTNKHVMWLQKRTLETKLIWNIFEKKSFCHFHIKKIMSSCIDLEWEESKGMDIQVMTCTGVQPSPAIAAFDLDG